MTSECREDVWSDEKDENKVKTNDHNPYKVISVYFVKRNIIKEFF